MGGAARRFADRLDSLFDRASEFQGDAEMLAHWAKYLCILSSGYLEVAVREVVAMHVGQCSPPHVVNYVEKQLEKFQNPKMESILQLIGGFKPEWREKVESASQGELKDAVDSIVATRHSIAHGGDVGITFVRIKNYYARARKVVKLLETECTT